MRETSVAYNFHFTLLRLRDIYRRFCIYICCYVQILDWMLGKGHAVLLRRAELKTFVDFHGNEVFSAT